MGAFTGCYVVVGADNPDIVNLNLPGIVSGLLPAVGFAWYSMRGGYGMHRYSPRAVLFYAMFFGALNRNAFLAPRQRFMVARSAVIWGWILLLVCGEPGFSSVSFWRGST